MLNHGDEDVIVVVGDIHGIMILVTLLDIYMWHGQVICDEYTMRYAIPLSWMGFPK
jgi:hypothetical protein